MPGMEYARQRQENNPGYRPEYLTHQIRIKF